MGTLTLGRKGVGQALSGRRWAPFPQLSLPGQTCPRQGWIIAMFQSPGTLGYRRFFFVSLLFGCHHKSNLMIQEVPFLM